MTVDYSTPLASKFLSQVIFEQLSFDTDSDYEAFIQDRLIPASMKVIDNYCNHNFQNNSGTITVDGNGKSVLPIHNPYLPIITVSSVKIDNSTVTTNIKTYETYIAYDGGTFTEDYQNVTITLTYGYATVPADIEYACAQHVANMLVELVRRKVLPDKVASSFDVASQTPNVFTDDIKKILDKYKYVDVDVT
jgi:hypothetical protein